MMRISKPGGRSELFKWGPRTHFFKCNIFKLMQDSWDFVITFFGSNSLVLKNFVFFGLFLLSNWTDPKTDSFSVWSPRYWRHWSLTLGPTDAVLHLCFMFRTWFRFWLFIACEKFKTSLMLFVRSRTSHWISKGNDRNDFVSIEQRQCSFKMLMQAIGWSDSSYGLYSVFFNLFSEIFDFFLLCNSFKIIHFYHNSMYMYFIFRNNSKAADY